MRDLTGIAKIISALSEFEYLTARQLTRLCYAASSLPFVRTQLKALVTHGLVLTLGGRAVNLPRIYTLSGRGREYAAGLGKSLASRFRPAEEQEKGHNVFVLRHTMAVTDVLISARLLSHMQLGIVPTRTMVSITLTRMVTESELKRKIYVPLADRHICLEPDASVEFHITESRTEQTQTWEDFFHIEVYRTHLAAWRYQQKVRGYVAYIETGVHEALFGTPAFSLAVLAVTDDLAQTLRRWTEDVLTSLGQPEHGERFFFGSCDPAAASPTELYLSPVWEQAFGTGKTPLLVLDEEPKAAIPTQVIQR